MLSCDPTLLRTRCHFSAPGFCLLPKALAELQGSRPAERRAVLEILAGMRPHHGSITWNGQPISPALRQEGEAVLFLPAGARARSWRTVHTWLTRQAHAYQATNRVEAAIRFLQLEAHRQQHCCLLPRHLQRRVAWAGMLARPGRIWLLEEPLAGLDEAGKMLVQGLIASLCNQHGIVVFTSSEPLEISGQTVISLPDFQP